MYLRLRGLHQLQEYPMPAGQLPSACQTDRQNKRNLSYPAGLQIQLFSVRHSCRPVHTVSLKGRRAFLQGHRLHLQKDIRFCCQGILHSRYTSCLQWQGGL